MKLRPVDSTIPLIPRSSGTLSSTWNLINATQRWRWRRCRRRSRTNLQVRQQGRANFKFPLRFDLHSVASAWKKVDSANGRISRIPFRRDGRSSPTPPFPILFLSLSYPRFLYSQIDYYARFCVKPWPLFSGYLIFVSAARVRDFKSLFVTGLRSFDRHDDRGRISICGFHPTILFPRWIVKLIVDGELDCVEKLSSAGESIETMILIDRYLQN